MIDIVEGAVIGVLAQLLYWRAMRSLHHRIPSDSQRQIVSTVIGIVLAFVPVIVADRILRLVIGDYVCNDWALLISFGVSYMLAQVITQSQSNGGSDGL